MVMDLFGSLLQELAEALKIKELHPDSNNSCLIKLKGGISVQLEIDAAEQFLIIGCNLGTVAPGRYRENIFREALKANGMPLPRHGIFAYSKKADQLVLHDKLFLKDLTGTKIFDFLTPFTEKARYWQQCVTRGEIPALQPTMTTGMRSKGMFGL